MTSITHIVPLFAPIIDGVGDYALSLARALRAEYSIDSRFVIADSRWCGPQNVDGFTVRGPTSFSKPALLEALDTNAPVILHYVGYAYHRKGVPSWLVSALEQWRARNPSARLITILHEIWSSGRPWTSAFYVSPLQRRLIERLLGLSARCFTSTQRSLKLLQKLKADALTLLPVSATIQSSAKRPVAPRAGPPWSALIFGQSWTRVPSIQKHERLLQALVAAGQLDCIRLVGKELKSDPPSEEIQLLRKFIPIEKVTIASDLSTTEVAEQFHAADFFLSPHNASDICKSSAIMSAFACECPVILPNRVNPAPLEVNRHFLSCSGSEKEIQTFVENVGGGILPCVATKARSWFEHNAAWEILAAKIAPHLEAPKQALASK